MTGISYEPALDAYHAAYRMIVLSSMLDQDDDIPVSSFRIADFYMAFPFLMKDIRLKKDHSWIRSISKKYDIERPYANLPDSPLLFDTMKIFQFAALQTLAMKQVFEIDALEKGYVRLVDSEASRDEFHTILSRWNGSSDLLHAIDALIHGYDVLGSDGLKARTGLMEYRYDAV